MLIDSFSGMYFWLSNFYRSPIFFDGYECATVEHAYQGAKAQDPANRLSIFQSKSPKEAKRAGRKVKLRPDWEEVKDAVMMECLIQKFTLHPDLRCKLLNTGDAMLIEDNHWGDTYWGVCDGDGCNKLGQMLMLVRSMLT